MQPWIGEWLSTVPLRPETVTEKSVIQYLNTDLDLVCDTDPALLASELESRGLWVHVTPGDDGQWYLLCEDSNDTEPESNINKFLDAVDSLSEEGRAIWERCSKREFNVGYDCGDEPWSFNQGLSNETLRRMAACGSTFRLTLYPFQPENEEAKESHTAKQHWHMSLRSMFILTTSLAFCLTAFRYWNPRGDFDSIPDSLLPAPLVLFEAAWSYVNFLGVRECNRIAAGRCENRAVTALLMGFALIILFQIVFFFRVIGNFGMSAAG